MLDRAVVAFDAWIDRHLALVLAGFSVAYFATTAVRAAARPFWHDEIFTIVSANLGSLAEFWRALHDGLDLAPPMSSLLTRLAHAVAGEGHVTTRLPAMIGFWAACLLLCDILRRHTNALLGLSAAILPCFSAGYRYSIEARPYGVLIGLSALALWAWLRTTVDPRRRWLVLLGVALAAGLWTHYIFLLTFGPIAAGEIVRQWRARRLSLPVWITLALAGAAVLPLVPLARAAMNEAGTDWSPDEVVGTSAAYAFLLAPLDEWPFKLCGAAVAIVAVLGPLLRRPLASPPRLAPHAAVAGAAWALLPAVAAIGAALTPETFFLRYLLVGLVGCLALGLAAVSLVSRRGFRADALVCAVLVVMFAYSVVDSLRPGRFVFRDPIATRPTLARELETPGPIAVTGGLVFLQLWYYAGPDRRDRLVYLADPRRASRRLGSNTIDVGLLALARWTDAPVWPYDGFLLEHAEYRVYEHGSGWLVAELRSAGADIAPVGRDPSARLLRVRMLAR
jgi:hypothetical protein